MLETLQIDKKELNIMTKEDWKCGLGCALLLAIVALFYNFQDWRDPRVVQCQKCKTVEGTIGALLPYQGSLCPCGGRVIVRRRMSYAEWLECEKRGYVTLSDGYAVDNFGNQIPE